ncbi:hypothetical protein Q9295_10930 [Xinfangfangia sp. CPCC 101601]|uniref:Uncharacterized protein n=1 Tax=Pseudogemmobacter lacusdianii TaxID=3069608 RepID=A0ABU0VYR4_9RHOB|nr:DUF6638 family protein [Xinfangfangia sp. CPCC 101601]MDQ2066890.1 hypothetical protein [Xinfangfangia sp. CPCC 101601]
MKHLISRGLMFGNLIEVSSPQLVARYNRALRHLTGRETTLSDFHIDLSGFSPEIGDELGDRFYLNPTGANRQFILLSTAQKDAPLLNIKFSTSRGILNQFIARNEAQLFALTARDVVAGELQGSVYTVDSPARLFDIRQVTVEADTIGGHVADAGKLAKLIERFRGEPEGWRDEALIAEMIALARKTGDVTRVPISLPAMSFEQGNFWTSHFGGIYVFRDMPKPAVIARQSLGSLGAMPAAEVMDFSHRNQIADWLARNQLVEPIVQARGADAGAILRQKMDFILVDAADRLGLAMGDARRGELRKLAYRLGAGLPAEFLGLAEMLRWVEGAGDWPRISSEHPAYFYTLRARPGRDRDLVNMLLAELAPMDVRQLFITHKERFYEDYAGWNEAKKTYVADFLAREYQLDREGARQALFGAEPGMDDLAPTSGGAASWALRGTGPLNRGAAVGPWGGR